MQSAVLNCQTHSYRRREPEKEVLYQAIADNLETFLDITEAYLKAAREILKNCDPSAQ